MKCSYCGREVIPNGVNCPKCRAEIVKKVETKAEPSDNKKEAK